MKRTKTSLRKECDKLWSLVIRAKGACEVCANPYYLNAHHIVGRKVMALRYDFRNGACLCAGHHRLNNISAHEDPVWFIHEWMAANRADDLRYVLKKRTETVKVNHAFYEDHLKRLKEALSEIQESS